MLFELGRTIATPGALEALEEVGQDPTEFLNRHITGAWGDLEPEDKHANDRALHDGTRIFSAYHTRAGVKLWGITEADRSSTGILLPSEY